MTITIDLAPDLEAQLRQKAEREGKPVEAVVHAVLIGALTTEAEDRAEAIAGIQRGLDASAEGKVKPLSQVIAEARERHGFPDSWPFDADPA